LTREILFDYVFVFPDSNLKFVLKHIVTRSGVVA